MQITIKGRKIRLSENDIEYARRRLGFALGRFADHVLRVTVLLEDANGPRGGVDKLCRVSVRRRRNQQIIANAEASETREAVDLAAERIGRAVARALERPISRRRNADSREVGASSD